MSFDLLLGDCMQRMAEMDEASVDAIVTDPPYGINFMGKAWDGKAIEEAASRPVALGGVQRLTGSPDSDSRHLIERTGSAFANRAGEAGAYDFSLKGNRAFQQWVEQWATEALRVLRPGGHALVFGGTRTYHRLAAGLEDAGFEIRDCLAWMYGSGFPKSLDVAKAIDKRVGTEGAWRREDHPGRSGSRQFDGDIIGQGNHASPANPEGLRHVYEAGSTEGQQWAGWGTPLKPAFEPIVVARKPLVGTVAGNVLKHGTGALNIDDCRIGDTVETWPATRSFASGISSGYTNGIEKGETQSTGEAPPGRWPANVVLDEEAAAILDEQTGVSFSGQPRDERGLGGIWQPSADGIPAGPQYGDSGGASRFFYCAKVSAAERNAGLLDFEELSAGVLEGRRDGSLGSITRSRNIHPTVKPVSLMRWLVRLVTPPDGLILDPFLGSGSTGIGAVLEGFRFVGIEREQNYMDIARARIEFWAEHGLDALEQVRKAEAVAAVHAELAAMGQQSLFGDADAETAAYNGPIPVPYDTIPY